MKQVIITIAILASLWLAYEKGEEYYWTEVAGCPCESCIEAYLDEQRSLKQLRYEYQLDIAEGKQR